MRKALIVLLTLILIAGSVVAASFLIPLINGDDSEHTHQYGEWKGDEFDHWKEADCHPGIISDAGKHILNAEFVCTVCENQYMKAEYLAVIRNSLQLSLYSRNILIKVDGSESSLKCRSDVIEEVKDGETSYYNFINGYTEIYTKSGDTWQRSTVDAVNNVDSYSFEKYPALQSLALALNEIESSFTFIPFERRLTFSENGQLTQSGVSDFDLTISYDESATMQVMTSSFNYDGKEYEIRITRAEDEIECPVVPSSGITVEPSEDGSYIIITDMGDCTDVNVVIPSEIDGVPVTEIGKDAFKDNPYIQSVVIPGSVKKIGESAFENCTQLDNVVLRDGVEIIEDNAFNMTDSRGYVEFTDSVKVVGENGFGFDIYHFDRGIWNFIGDINKFVQIDFQGDRSSPSGNRDMYVNGEPLRSVVIDTATRIEDYAFLGHDLAAEYYIGKQVEYIGSLAVSSAVLTGDSDNPFAACNVYYDGTLEEFMQIEKAADWVRANWNLYCENELIDTLEIGDVEDIPAGLWYGCISLKHLIINEGVKTIGMSVFDLIEFESIVLPSSLTFIGWSAFYVYDNPELFTIIPYDNHQSSVYLRQGNNLHYMLLVRPYANITIHPDCKIRQQMQWEIPGEEDWYIENYGPLPTT